MTLRRSLVCLLMASLLATAGAASTAAQNNSRQVGLVNVSTGDVDLLNGVNLAVAANVIATVCDVTVPIAVLAIQVVDEDGATFCQATTAPITVTQSQPGDGGGTPNPNGGNRSRQAGLVNISLGDVAILNNLNLALAANLLITACDLKVHAAILAVQGVSDTGDTVCMTAAGPINIDQSQ